MKFRSKILLSVFLPAVLLVTGAAGLAYREADAVARRNAGESLESTAVAFKGALDQHRDTLKRFIGHFGNPRVEEEVTLAIEKGDTETLRLAMDAEFSYIDTTPDLYEVRARDGKLVARAPKADGLPPQAWEKTGDVALTEIDGEPYLAMIHRYPKGSILFGLKFSTALDFLSDVMRIRIVLERGGRTVYSSLAGRARAPSEEEWSVAGIPYLSRTIPTRGTGFDRIVLASSLAGREEARRRALASGLLGVAMAALVAALVSSLLARGVSRPVEALVVATKRVGEGDYTAKVEVPGRDELARLGSAFNDMTEGLRKRRDIMEKTLSRDVAEELMKGVELGGERREVTVMFMDVRGFTRATEGVDPAEVVAMLNDMMGELAASIARHGGNVNKFLGDGLLAMFGAPKDLPDHALKAARAALEMQSAMTAWGERRAGRGLPPLKIGIGLNTGVVLGGKVGSKERLEYTLIGEEVNLASRVCGKAAPGQVLATKTTADRLAGRLGLTELEPVQVKGLSYPVQIYEVKA